MSSYAPVGCDELTRAAYQTVVVSLAASVPVLLICCGEALLGTPANLAVLVVELLNTEYDASNEPRLGTA